MKFLKRLWQREPTNAEVLKEMGKINIRLSQLDAEFEAFQLDLYDYVDDTLKPLTKRVGAKLRRSDKEDLNTSEPSRKKAILSGEDIRILGHGAKKWDY